MALHDLPVLDRIRKAAAKTGKKLAAEAIFRENLTPILKALDKYGIDPNAFIWAAYDAYMPDSALKLLIDERNTARQIRNRIRELAAEIAELERKACALRMRGVSEEHAKAIENLANSVNVPLISASNHWAIATGKPGKAAYLRAFMIRLSEERCLPGGVLHIRYKDGKQAANRLDAVIARMASVVLGEQVTIAEVRAARREFGMAVSVRTEPPNTSQGGCQ